MVCMDMITLSFQSAVQYNTSLQNKECIFSTSWPHHSIQCNHKMDELGVRMDFDRYLNVRSFDLFRWTLSRLISTRGKSEARE